MYKVFSISLMALAFASCTSSGDRKPTAPTPSTTPITFNTPAGLDSSKAGTLTNTATAPTTNSAGSVALNPAHGAPGHRCEIPVGAPLNSTPSSTPAPAPTSTPAPMMIQTQTPPPPQPANNNARLNPAHGAPGHDCSIPVGQPLKS